MKPSTLEPESTRPVWVVERVCQPYPEDANVTTTKTKEATPRQRSALLALSERFSVLAVVAGGLLLFGMSWFIGVEVLLRKFFRISTGGAEEYSSYALAILSAWSFSYALFTKAHIRVDAVYLKLRRNVRLVLDVAALGAFAAYTLPMTWYGWKAFSLSFTKGSLANTPLQTPLWIPMLLWILGIAFFAWAVLLLLGETLTALLRGDTATASALAGCPLLEEEIDEEKALAAKTLGATETKREEDR